MSKSRNKKIAKELIRMRNKLTKRQQKEYTKVFNQLQSYVVTPRVGVEGVALTRKDFISNKDWNNFVKTVLTVVITNNEIVTKEIVKFGVDVYQLSEELIPKVTNKVLNTLNKDIAGKKVTQITKVTESKINAIITDGMKNGVNLKDIAKTLEKEIHGMSKSRAMTIARTETASSYSIATNQMLKEGGFSRMWWHVGGGKTDRPNHVAIDGETISGDEAYSIGLLHPHDPDADASEVINCYCVEIGIGGNEIDE